MLIYEGNIDFKQLIKCKIDVNDLLSMLREQGYFDITMIAYAIFEPSGNLSVLPKGEFRPVVAKDLGDEFVTRAELKNVLVADGQISKSGLNEIEKDNAWLYNELKISSKKELKNIALAIYDPIDGMKIYQKNEEEFIDAHKSQQ